MRKILLFCLAVIILPASSLFAVDGYKSLKFGISLEEVRKSKICAWVDEKGKNNLLEKDVNNLYCTDFKFNNKLIIAVAWFIDNKFLQYGL